MNKRIRKKQLKRALIGLLDDAPQAYREVPLFSIGVFYGLQECSVSGVLFLNRKRCNSNGGIAPLQYL